jgi:hypothetical protein
MQNLCESKGLFKDFVKLPNGVPLGYFQNILE